MILLQEHSLSKVRKIPLEDNHSIFSKASK